jgi:glutamyl/glutaminyl-tRNA synthetase
MYDYREFHMNLLKAEHFRRFIREEMIKEYGLVINKSPSSFDTTSSSTISEHLMTIMHSEYNITLVKAHMEEVHQMQSWDNTARLYERLFPSVISVFDSAIQPIEKQSPAQRVLGLFSIAAAAVNDEGVSFSDLEAQLQR